MSFLTKEDRQACWDLRDEYWKCLDDAKTESECQEFRKKYEKFCPSQWVKHFDRKREYLKFKAQIEQDGYIEEHLPKRVGQQK
ncbi:cytochrome c oxidase assembly factor 6 homolog [Fopius arisanus]|uniref:Cytochrome c oxidase assembly factor 6 homolog n=1 Tax=Fopius arisanus TaxID=64838 RepID=A0A9R1THB0_9HYME|nr:PREDICTED: cytochrome c oxidase assembly factor 6 homolog [Fopius arisanus]